MFEWGKGVPQDHKKAVKWYTKAAEQGHASSQFFLGQMFDKGKGVPQDYKEAVKWFTKAAEQGLAISQYNLGFMFCKGKGVPQDYIQAYKWLILAAAQGNQDAVKLRHLLNHKMSAKQISKAEKLAKEFKPKIDNSATEGSTKPKQEDKVISNGTNNSRDSHP